jgi:hypothetical protein
MWRGTVFQPGRCPDVYLGVPITVPLKKLTWNIQFVRSD